MPETVDDMERRPHRPVHVLIKGAFLRTAR